MRINNLPKVAAQWNSGATRDSNPGPRARIPSALTTEPLSHNTVETLETSLCGRDGIEDGCRDAFRILARQRVVDVNAAALSVVHRTHD